MSPTGALPGLPTNTRLVHDLLLATHHAPDDPRRTDIRFAKYVLTSNHVDAGAHVAHSWGLLANLLVDGAEPDDEQQQQQQQQQQLRHVVDADDFLRRAMHEMQIPETAWRASSCSVFARFGGPHRHPERVDGDGDGGGGGERLLTNARLAAAIGRFQAALRRNPDEDCAIWFQFHFDERAVPGRGPSSRNTSSKPGFPDTVEAVLRPLIQTVPVRVPVLVQPPPPSSDFAAEFIDSHSMLRDLPDVSFNPLPAALKISKPASPAAATWDDVDSHSPGPGARGNVSSSSSSPPPESRSRLHDTPSPPPPTTRRARPSAPSSTASPPPPPSSSEAQLPRPRSTRALAANNDETNSRDSPPGSRYYPPPASSRRPPFAPSLAPSALRRAQKPSSGGRSGPGSSSSNVGVKSSSSGSSRRTAGEGAGRSPSPLPPSFAARMNNLNRNRPLATNTPPKPPPPTTTKTTTRSSTRGATTSTARAPSSSSSSTFPTARKQPGGYNNTTPRHKPSPSPAPVVTPKDSSPSSSSSNNNNNTRRRARRPSLLEKATAKAGNKLEALADKVKKAAPNPLTIMTKELLLLHKTGPKDTITSSPAADHANASPATAGSPAPPPADEPASILRDVYSAAAATAADDSSIDDLNALLPTSSGAPSAREWAACCQLLPHLDAARIARDPQREPVDLRGCALTFRPHQLWAAYQLLLQRGGGGFLAHEPGLGKTYVVLLAVLLKALVVRSHARCQADWAALKDGRKRVREGHFARDAPAPAQEEEEQQQQRGVLRCPTQGPGDVQCFCVPGGVTRRLHAALGTDGFSLIQVPTQTISHWQRVAETARFNTSVYNFIVVSGANVSASLKQSPEQVKLKFRMDATRAVQPVADTFDIEWAPTAGRSTADIAGTYIFVVDHHETRFWRAFTYNTGALLFPMPPTGSVPNRESVYGAPVSLHFIDEAHKCWSRQSLPMRMARRHRHVVGSGQAWFVTATPFVKQPGLEDMAAPLELIDRQHSAELPLLLSEYEAAVADRRDLRKKQAFVAHFARVFDQAKLLRFLSTSLFLGQPISQAIQAVRPTFVSRRLPPPLVAPVQRFVDDAQADFATDGNETWRDSKLHFVSLFPSAAATLNRTGLPVVEVANDSGLRADIRSIPQKAHRDREGPQLLKRFPYITNHVLEFAEHSPKLLDIMREIERMNQDRRQRSGTPDAPPSSSSSSSPAQQQQQQWATMKKMVIMTPDISTALFTYAWLREMDLRQRPQNNNNNNYNKNTPPSLRPVLYHADLLRAQRDALLADFSSLARGTPRVMVTPAAALLEGADLSAASYQVLAAPLGSAARQRQAFARTNRDGQRLPVAHTVLALEESPVDRIKTCAAAGRTMRSDPFDLARELELAPAVLDAHGAGDRGVVVESCGGGVNFI